MARKPIILCVDDTPTILEGRKMLLEAAGYQVLPAASGDEALQLFASNSIDLVLLDYHMPGMKGDVVAARMREQKPDIPIALLSSDDYLPRNVLEAADAFISKSAPITNFLQDVDYLVGLHFLFQPLQSSLNFRKHIDGHQTQPRSV